MRSVLFPFFILLGVWANAQDVNYWQSSYCAGGFFTPGAVIANTRDSGVLFYNPALLGYNNKNAVSVSGNIYQIANTKIKNGVGNGLNLSGFGLGVQPLAATNTLYLKLKKPFTIAYGFYRNTILDFNATQRKDTKQNVLADVYSPGDELFVGQYAVKNATTETKILLSGGFKQSNKLALGFNMESTLRESSLSQTSTSRAIINLTQNLPFQPISSTEAQTQWNYLIATLKFKAGANYEIDQHNHLGLLVTTPSFGVYSNAGVYIDFAINNIVLDTNLSTLNLLASTRQTGLKAAFKTPWSFALGYVHDFKTGQLYMAAEYFLAQSEYNIIKPANEYFIRPSNIAGFNFPSLALSEKRRAVFNYSIGLRQKIAENASAFVALRTDYNYLDRDILTGKANNILSNTSALWNSYHLQIGGEFRKRKYNMRLGLIGTYGHTSEYTQPINFDSPREDNILQGDIQQTSASFFKLGLQVTYLHNL